MSDARPISYPLGVQGTFTRVLDAGPRDGLPVVLLHGLGARADRWAANVQVLGDAGYRALAFDQPGHGFAGKPRDFVYDSPSFARFLGAFLDELGLDQVVLVGTSLGGHVASIYTADHRERVRGLGLVAPVGLVHWDDDRRAATAGRAQDVSREGIEAKLRILLHDQSAVTPELVEEEWRINNSPGGPEAMAALAAYVRNRVNADLAIDALATVPEVPVLLVWGEDDQSVSVDSARSITDRLPQATLLRVPDAGHAPHVEQPEVVNAALLELIGRSW